jgi:hypothetical protein
VDVQDTHHRQPDNEEEEVDVELVDLVAAVVGHGEPHLSADERHAPAELALEDQPPWIRR